ncbi:EF-P 5-aminopentanol modification-associated protein YfmF [Mycoplasma sp. P36-A1]|uniref:EF-P 5-aminopentanol modification-associated protein YfmF n=1 Tax=Mycoplasma sp. P36-A1 TaxID=3252900 RepID=UPI003C2F3716
MKNNYNIIKEDKFKTNYLNIRFLVEANKENTTLISLLTIYMVYCNDKHRSYKAASDYLDTLYGMKFDINTSLKGENIVIDFNTSFISSKYLDKTQNYLEKVIEELLTYIYKPLQNNNLFDDETFNLRKYDLAERIKAAYDDKTSYAFEKYFETFAKNYPLALNESGYLKQLENIEKEDIQSIHKKLIKQTPIISGIVSSQDYDIILKLLENTIPVQNYKESFKFYNINKTTTTQEIIDSQQIVQSKLLLGFSTKNKLQKEDYHKVLIFNAIFGMGSNSYLFKIVREKENLCYTIRAMYEQYSNSLTVMSGIERKNYQKTATLIQDILTQIKNGEFSDQDLQDAKIVMSDVINKTNDSQAGLVMYKVNRLMQDLTTDLNQDLEQINKVNREDIIKIANLFELKTIYLLSGDKNE